MKVLVTGSSGFIGAHLCHHLTASKHEVVTLSQSPTPNSSYSFGWNDDLEDALSNVDCIVHLAGRAHLIKDVSRDPMAEFRKVNVELSTRLATAAVENGVRRFVFVSSIGVLGNEGTFDEHSPYAPVEDYARSKMEAELALTEIFSKTSDCEFVVLRPPLVYGARAKGNFARLVWLVRNAPLLPFGAVHAKRSYIGIRNLLSLIDLCLEHPMAAGRTFLAADGADISLAELVQLLADSSGARPIMLPVPPQWLRTIGRILGRNRDVAKLLGTLTIDITQARSVLGWSPPHSVEADVIRMIGAANLGG